jgi:UDP-N-acetylmuramoyl-tripeptide--D-alanyl-D-alanine ligase
MNLFSAMSISDITGGSWLRPPENGLAPRGLSIDSRTIKSGEAFLAVRGETFDGHDFVQQATEAGAAMAIVEDANAAAIANMPVLRVSNTVTALGTLAAAHRDRLGDSGTRVIAVTGSNGKTTTRRLIHEVLSSRFRCDASPKSFNNHLGVPLTLLRSGPGGPDRFLVVEIGTNHPGEIAALGRIVRPNCAVITNVGRAHIGHFQDRAAIGREKASLAAFVEPGGLAVVPGGDLAAPSSALSPADSIEHRCSAGAALLAEPLKQLNGRFEIVRFGAGHDSDLVATNIQVRSDGTRFVLNGGPVVHLGLLGRHNVLNALAAIAVGQWAGVPLDHIIASLAGVANEPMRLDRRLVGREAPLLVINDAYNANPDSVSAALSTLAEIPLPHGRARRVFVLGDMLELGDCAADLHRQVGEGLASPPGSARPIDLAILIGSLAKLAAEPLAAAWPKGTFHTFEAADAALGQRVAALLRPADVVLLKASRAMKLERLMPAMEERFGR